MKEKFVKVKEWTKRNTGIILTIGGYAIAATAAVLLGKSVVESISKYLEGQEQELLEVVRNNLRLKKDGEIVEIITGRTSDYNTKTITSRRWTKINDELVYLGKHQNVTDLDINDKVLKRMDVLSSGVMKAIKKSND